MKEFKTQAYIQSLNMGKMKSDTMDQITVLQKIGDNDYIVDYKGIKCHTIYNWFVCAYFADDVYWRIT